jgi:hypothetical protein
MISLPTKPTCCPCGKEWEPVGSKFYHCLQYKCSSDDLWMWGTYGGAVGFHKLFGEITLIWWSDNTNTCILTLNDDPLTKWDHRYVDWIVPLDISEERLQALISMMIFS